MKATLIVLVAVFVALATARTLQDDERLFADFKATYGRKYDAQTDSHRFTCFRQNLDLIDKRNAEASGARHGVNQFADLCPAEFAKMYLGLKPSNKTQGTPLKFSDAQVKASCSAIDWRTKGAVTPVKNQGQCGSCWSFSTTGNVEGQWQIAGNPLTSLSEEELVQCSHNGNAGCNGGLMDYAFQWIITNGGITTEAAYPYTSGIGITGKCKSAKITNYAAKISSFQDVAQNEDQMATFVCGNGPLSIGVDAQSWQTYQGGILKDCAGTQLDHGVLIVGFDNNNNPPYWIVKNSWGASWGESGYIRVEKGTNQCGITQSPSSSKV